MRNSETDANIFQIFCLDFLFLVDVDYRFLFVLFVIFKFYLFFSYFYL